MSRISTILLTGLLLALAAPALALGPVDVEAGVGLHSQYVWRGMVVTPEAVLQPSVSVGLMGLSFGYWGNVDLSDVNGYETSLTESDWTVGWELSLPTVTVGAGFIYYDFPTRGPADTSELYAGVEAGVPFAPHLWVFKDIDDIKGAYWSVGGTYSRELAEGTSLDVGVDLGWGSEGYSRGYFGVASSGATDLTIAASMPWHPVPLLTIAPHVTYATLMGDAKTAVDDADGDTDAFFYGVTATVGF